jgi:dTDP-glucose pyrophosphorylase
MRKLRPIASSVALDLLAVVAAYLLAVVFRVGGRLEFAWPGEAVVIALFAAAIHVTGNAALGVYGEGWPRDGRQLAVLALPALFVGGAVAVLNAVSDLHSIPYGAIPTAVVGAIVFEAAVHLRPRWATIARAVTGRRGADGELETLRDLPDLATVVIPDDSPLRRAISVIEKDVSRIALIVDRAGVLRGVVTDGDVRRALLAGADIDGPVTAAMHEEPVVAHAGITDDMVLELMRRHTVRQIPLLDTDGRVTDIRVLDLLHEEGTGAPERTPVLIMAGGLGSRLGDLTRKTPKPLVRVGGKPILDLLIEDLASQGLRRVVLAVNYRADQIEAHVGDGRRFGAEVTYVRENEPLGTAGAIRLAAPHLTEPEFVVANADLLTRVNFRELLSFHRREAHHLTVGVIESTMQLRYGLIETKGTRVVAIREKPALKHFINAGIYVLDRELIQLVPDGRFDMDALISAAMQESVVGCFPIHEYWTDIGEPDDLRRASDEFKPQPVRRFSD